MKFVHRLVFLLSVTIVSTSAAFAQTPVPSITLPQATMTKTEYFLPYPGILPDHPLYMLKRVRDRILDFLIVDPMRKAEFYILQADKHIGMGTLLIEKGKGELGKQMINEGEQYFPKTLAILIQAKQNGKDFPDYLIERLTKSLAKHEEVLVETMMKTSGVQSAVELVKKTMMDVANLQ